MRNVRDEKLEDVRPLVEAIDEFAFGSEDKFLFLYIYLFIIIIFANRFPFLQGFPC